MSVYRASIACRETLDSPSCTLSTAARCLWQYLASRVDGAGRCHPSMDRLRLALGEGTYDDDGRRLGVSEDTVQRARRELVAAGAIKVRFGGGTASNEYLLPLATVPQLSTPPRRVRGVVVHTPPTGAVDPPDWCGLPPRLVRTPSSKRSREEKCSAVHVDDEPTIDATPPGVERISPSLPPMTIRNGFALDADDGLEEFVP